MTRDPRTCDTLPELRAEIDRIDRALVALLASRTACIDRAIEIKRAAGLPARIEERVADVLAKVGAEAAARGFDPLQAETLWRQLIEWAIAREERALHDQDKADTGIPPERARTL